METRFDYMEWLDDEPDLTKKSMPDRTKWQNVEELIYENLEDPTHESWEVIKKEIENIVNQKENK